MNVKYLNTSGIKRSSFQKIEIHVSLNIHVILEYFYEMQILFKWATLSSLKNEDSGCFPNKHYFEQF